MMAGRREACSPCPQSRPQQRLASKRAYLCPRPDPTMFEVTPFPCDIL
jgi:hypothetical protein